VGAPRSAGFVLRDRGASRAASGEVLVERVDGGLVPVGLHVAVGVGGLRDRGVAELLLHPTEIRPVREQPSGEGVPGGVVLPIGQTGLGQQGLPHIFDEADCMIRPTLFGNTSARCSAFPRSISCGPSLVCRSAS